MLEVGGGDSKRITLLEGFHTSPACPSGRRSMKKNIYGEEKTFRMVTIEASYKRAEFKLLSNAEAHKSEI
jgi:hypothetical protein